MKRKIIILLLLMGCLYLFGCGSNMTAREAVDDYLLMYITLDDSVVDQINDIVDAEDLTDNQKDIYKEVLKRQYTSLTYIINNETYDGDIAYINTTINVFNLYDAQLKSLEYFEEHKDEFNDEDGNYDKSKFLDYKLNKMKEQNETISYEIEFKVIKTDNKWEVSQLSNEDLEKIHGIYSEE